MEPIIASEIILSQLTSMGEKMSRTVCGLHSTESDASRWLTWTTR